MQIGAPAVGFRNRQSEGTARPPQLAAPLATFILQSSHRVPRCSARSTAPARSFSPKPFRAFSPMSIAMACCHTFRSLGLSGFPHSGANRAMHDPRLRRLLRRQAAHLATRHALLAAVNSGVLRPAAGARRAYPVTTPNGSPSASERASTSLRASDDTKFSTASYLALLG